MNFEIPKSEQINNTPSFTETESFNELYEKLSEIETIEGSQKSYTADELVVIIEGVRKNPKEIKYVPSTGGLKDTVMRLVSEEYKLEKNVTTENRDNSHGERIIDGLEKNKEQLSFRDTKSWLELYVKLRKIDVLEGRRKSYDPKDQTERIDAFRNGFGASNSITNTGGLKDTVEWLKDTPGLFEEVKDFDELYKTLREHDTFIRTGKEYVAEEHISKIESAREDPRLIKDVTRSDDLREIVVRLLKNEEIAIRA